MYNKESNEFKGSDGIGLFKINKFKTYLNCKYTIPQ